jgi:hypothetical protein
MPRLRQAQAEFSWRFTGRVSVSERPFCGQRTDDPYSCRSGLIPDILGMSGIKPDLQETSAIKQSLRQHLPLPVRLHNAQKP